MKCKMGSSAIIFMLFQDRCLFHEGVHTEQECASKPTLYFQMVFFFLNDANTLPN